RSLRLGVKTQPAYESLRAKEAVSDDELLTANTALASVRAQITRAMDLYVQADHTWISDGNARSVVSGAGRYRFGEHVALLYTAGAASFTERDTSYWSPSWYLTQGLGLDI